MRIRKPRSVKLVPEAGGEAIESSFSESGIVFVVSNRSLVSLSFLPEEGDLIHAVLILKDRAISAAALRHDSSIDGMRSAELHSGSRLRVGMGSFRFEQERCRIADSIFAKRGILIASAIAAAASVSVPYSIVRTGSVPVKSAAIEPAEVRHAEPDESALIEEAKAHMREGRIEQARMALVEAKEMKPYGEASRMIEAIDAADTKPRDSGVDVVKLEERSRSLFDLGRKKLAEGDGAGAYRDLSQAAKELDSQGSGAPFADALRAALSEAKKAAWRDAAEKIESAGALLESAGTREAKSAVEELKRAMVLAADAHRILPDSRDAAAMSERSGDALSAAVGRWVAAADAAMQLSGCNKARPIYEEIARSIEGSEDSNAAHVRERLSVCVNPGVKGR